MQDAIYDLMRRGRDVDGLINAKMEHIAQLRASITRGTAIISDMPRGGKKHDWTETAAKIADMETELRADIDRVIGIKTAIMSAIATVPELELRTLLTHRYVNRWTWGKIADAMHYDRTTIWRKHKEAMRLVRVSPDELEHLATLCNI